MVKCLYCENETRIQCIKCQNLFCINQSINFLGKTLCTKCAKERDERLERSSKILSLLAISLGIFLWLFFSSLLS